MKKRPFNPQTNTLFSALLVLIIFTEIVQAQYDAERNRYRAQDAISPPPENAVLFVGSSSIRLWEGLTQDFADYHVIQRGFGGSTIGDLQKFAGSNSTSSAGDALAKNVVQFYSPRAIVVWSGTNDVRPGQTGQYVATGFQNFVSLVRAQLPNTRIFYLGITKNPHYLGDAAADQRRIDANNLIQGYINTSGDTRLHYIDLPSLFESLTTTSSPSMGDYYVDTLHSNKAGYALWTAKIRADLAAAGILPDKSPPLNPLSPASGAKVLLDFGANDGTNGSHTTGTDANGNQWNNWHSISGNIQLQAGEHLGGLIDTAGSGTGIKIVTTGPLNTGWTAAEVPLTSNATALGDLGVPTATKDGFKWSGLYLAGFYISGLDPARAYDLKFFGSENSTATQTTRYTATGINTTSADIVASGTGIGDGGVNHNTRHTAVLTEVVPNSFGEIHVDLSVVQGSEAHLNAMQIVVLSKKPTTITAAPTASPLVFGQRLSNSTLTGGAASFNGTSVPGTFAFADPQNVPPVGNSTQSVIFTPSDLGNFTSAMVDVPLSVAPNVNAATRILIDFGSDLSANANFLTANPDSIGNYWNNYKTNNGTLSNLVFTDNSTSGIVLAGANTAAGAAGSGGWGIANGTVNLANSNLNVFNAYTDGIFVFSGNATLTFSGLDSSKRYSFELFGARASGNATATGNRTTLYTMTSASGATTKTLQTSGYNLGAGGVNYNTSNSVVFSNQVPDGTNRITLKFEGNAGQTSGAYLNALQITVESGNSQILAPPVASSITYGQALSNATLSGGSASVAGSFAFTNPSTVPSAGTSIHEVTFTPSDANNYNPASANVSVTVAKATPVVTWNNPAAISYGTALSGAQLNASASVNGTFSYTPVSGTMLGAGNQTLGVVFTPGDATNYNSVNQSVTLLISTATQTIGLFSEIGDKVYGSAPFEVTPPISTSGLPVVLSVKSGPATVSGNMVTVTGVGTVVLAANQSGNANFNAASEVTTSFTVSKPTPAISAVPTVGGLTYGQALSNATLSGGSASVAGSFAFTHPSTAPSAGTSIHEVTFTPSDANNYNPASANVSVTVAKATPVVTWNNPAAISYGTALSGAQLNASASVNGTFSYTPVSGTMLGAGNQTLGVVFTPGDATNYNSVNQSVTLLISTATQTIGAFSAIGDKVYGSAPFEVTPPISTSGLPVVLSVKSGPATVSGNMVTVTGVGTVVLAANQSGNANFNAASEVTTSFTVSKATPAISAVPTVGGLTYGQALSNATLSGGSASVAGSFAFTHPSTAPSAGTSSHEVTFTPSDASNHHSATANVSVTVAKATPVVTWNNPAAISYGTALSGAQLNASASVNGTFSYTPVSGTMLGAGNQTLGVVFTPGDATNYNSVNQSVTLLISTATQTIGAFSAIGDKVYGSAPFEVTPPISTSGLPVVLSVKSGPATVSGNMVTVTGVGTVVLAANQSGNANFNAASEVTTSFTVSKATPAISVVPTVGGLTYGQALSNATLSGGSASVAGSFAFTHPSTAPSAGTSSHEVTFTPSDASNHHSATANVSVTVAKATPTITTLPAASAITSGQTLANATLSGGVGSVVGNFAFTIPETAPEAGTATHSVTFTPSDSTNYNPVTANISVTVNQVSPTIPTITVQPSAASITYGQTLANATLTGGNASVAGSFAFTSPETTPPAGTTTHSVIFTPTDIGNYSTATTNVSVIVGKATPMITTLPTAMAITYGQTLANSRLSGGAGSVPGSFAFTSPATAPAVGTALQSIAFEPTDSVNYHSVTGSVSVTVAPVVIPPVIDSLTTSNGTVGTPFSYVITATNNATGFSTSTLPEWLTLNSTTGVLSGTPTQSEVLEITLTATNTAGTDAETLRIKIEAESSVLESIKFLGGASLPNGGEIVDYAEGKVLTTNSGNGSHGVEILTLSYTGAFTGNSTSVDLSSVFGGASNVRSVSSVLASPLGFGVATVIPTATGATDLGKIVIFDIGTQVILQTLEVGYHPDSVTITPDGAKLVVVNEGEFVSTGAESTFARPGSISVVDISSVTTLAQAANLTQSDVTTFDFSDDNLAPGVNINNLRNPRLDTSTTKTPDYADIEPEHATATNSQVFVTLQENNAVAVFDFATSKYAAIYELGTIEQLIDASDRDGANNNTSIAINDSVHGLPMPDAIVRFTHSGVGYLLTANEGDARPDDGDIASGSTLTSNMTSEVAALANNTGIGRLQLLRYEGDTNTDGLIDTPIMMGTRSFSIWNSSNGSLVYDSGSTLEMFAAANDAQTFNTDSGNLLNTDTRSDDKGPEPEAIAFATIDGKDYAFVGAERQNGIFAFDITNFSNVKVVGYFNTISSTEDSGAAYISPESIKVIHADTNPSGKDLILVGFKGTQGGNNGSVAVFEFFLKITPTITSLPKAGSINVGQSLGNSTLSGGVASVPGNFAFTAPSTIPPVGQSNQLVRFTPTDTITYSPVILSIPVFAIDTSGNSTIINSGETVAFTVNQIIKAPEGNGTLLLANSTVTLQSNGTTEFSGNIEGNGGLVKEGSGTLVLSGNNSFSGPIMVTNGAIEISGNGLLAGGNYTGTIENEGIFKFAAVSNQTLSGEIVGSGEIVKENASTLVLAGSSTAFTGNITANDGTLKISGFLPNSRVSIESNAMLVGTGVIGDIVVTGIIAPENSPGPLTTGNYTFNSGGNYTWEISNATGAAGIGWDQIIANGNVFVNSTPESPFIINVTPFGEVLNWSDYQSRNWSILSYTGTLTGFDSFKFLIQSSLGAVGNWSLASEVNELQLRYTGIPLPPAGGNSGFASQAPSNFYSEQKSKKTGASKKKSGEKKSKSDKKSSKDKSGGKIKLKKKR